MAKRKILLIGGAGYVGSVTAEEMANDYQVVVLDNLYEGHREAVHPQATFIEASMADEKLLDEIFGAQNSGEVHHSVHALQGRCQPGIICHVTFDQLKALRQTAVSVDQTVVDDCFVSSALQCTRRMTADISRATHHQNRQWTKPSLSLIFPSLIDSSI